MHAFCDGKSTHAFSICLARLAPSRLQYCVLAHDGNQTILFHFGHDMATRPMGFINFEKTWFKVGCATRARAPEKYDRGPVTLRLAASRAHSHVRRP